MASSNPAHGHPGAFAIKSDKLYIYFLFLHTKLCRGSGGRSHPATQPPEAKIFENRNTPLNKEVFEGRW